MAPRPMLSSLGVVVLALGLHTGTTQTLAQSNDPQGGVEMDVRSFGAVGDGTHDDTGRFGGHHT